MSERDEFEAWAKAEGYQIDRVPSQPRLYSWASTQCCWEAWQSARAPQAVRALTEPVVRFCPECGSIGEVPSSNINCCPDGSAARYVPQKFAEICQHTFHMLIGKIGAATQPSQEQPARQKYQD